MLHICIRDIQGFIHQKTTLSPNCKQINIYLLTKGTYTISYSIGDLMLVEKFIKQ